MLRVAAIVVLLLVLPSSAHANKRVALVIGNSAYQHTPKLTNPRNDADDMAGALKRNGFQVIVGLDLDKAAFDRKLKDFSKDLQGASVGVFFYAGHALQVAGQNYLVPIDAQLSTASALEFEMVRADVVQRVMEHETNTNLLFLDACRDNPLARSLARAMGTRSAQVGSGLAPVASGVGTLISFSTQPGNVALDGGGRNSPYSAALVKRVAASKDDLSALLIDVRNDVRTETQGKQVPWEHSALTSRFYFSLPSAPASPPAEAPGDTPTGPYDGSWLVEAVAISGCLVKGWKNRLLVRNSDIILGEQRRGRVEKNGRFKYSVPNFNVPGTNIVVSGSIGEKTGKGSYSVTTCTGTIKVTKEQ